MYNITQMSEIFKNLKLIKQFMDTGTSLRINMTIVIIAREY